MDKKAQKKKDREKRVKRQLLLQRQAKHREEKKQREWEERLEAETNPTGQKQKPFRYSDFEKARTRTPDEVREDKAKSAEVRAKLEHNLKVLQALEAEWKREQVMKGNVNAALEADGAVDLKSKIDLMNEKLLTQVKAAKENGEINENGEVQLGQMPDMPQAPELFNVSAVQKAEETIAKMMGADYQPKRKKKS